MQKDISERFAYSLNTKRKYADATQSANTKFATQLYRNAILLEFAEYAMQCALQILSSQHVKADNNLSRQSLF